MYITKIDLNMNNRDVLYGFVDLEILHSKIENCFDGGRQHPLWTVFKNQIIMISSDKPIVPSNFGKATSKPYTPQINNNTVLTYRIVANPTIKKNGKRIPLNLHQTKKQPYCATDWFKDQLKAHGAIALSCTTTDYDIKTAKHNKVTFLTTTFEGQLLVTDDNVFNKALVKGIGHEKAFGCGLLLVKI